jgi:hypothetical protein
MALVRVRLEREPVPVVLSSDTLFTLSGEVFPGPTLHPAGDRLLVVETPDAFDSSTGQTPARLILVQNFFEELSGLLSN